MREWNVELSESRLALEAARLAALNELDILDTPPEPDFDTIVECTRRTFGCKIALISLVDERRQWFKAKCGLDASETPRGEAFCSHAIERDDIMIVPDASADPRFADNPLVLGTPHIRFYAGVPLRVHGGRTDGRSFAMGTLCIIDTEPRSLDPDDADALRRLAKPVETLLETRAALIASIKTSSEYRVLLHKLDLAHWQLRQAERMANIGSWTLTLADDRIEWSDQLCAIHGVPVGTPPPLETALNFYPPHARAQVTAALAHAIESGDPFDIEVDFLTAQGEHRRVRTIGELESRDGAPRALIGVLQDVTARYRIEQALRRSADTDDLTKLANRARFNDRFAETITTARAAGMPLAVLLIDLDNFKAVNDRAGHRAGDELLKSVAARLTLPYLTECFAARLGGDEFVLIVSEPALLADLPCLLRKLLADLHFGVPHDDGMIAVSGTIGAALLDATVPDPSGLLHNADLALYAAKNVRRGTAMIFGQSGGIVPDDLAAPRTRAA